MLFALPVVDDEKSTEIGYLRYKGTEIGCLVGLLGSPSSDAAVVDCGGGLVAFGAHNPR